MPHSLAILFKPLRLLWNALGEQGWGGHSVGEDIILSCFLVVLLVFELYKKKKKQATPAATNSTTLSLVQHKHTRCNLAHRM